MPKIRNIGIFAHVDAGKTTLSEQILAHTGAIRVRGSVDAGTAHTDRMSVERRRGISVKATCVQFCHRDVRVNLIDTPGHVDFSAEVERSLWALDAAVIVVCAVAGVQPQTEVLFDAMQEQKIPVIFFINKLDRDGADPQRVLMQIRRLLTPKAVMLSDLDALTELVCEENDDLAERYLLGEQIPEAEVFRELSALSCRGKAYPVLCGSALRDEGVDPLLDAIVSYFPDAPTEENLCGVVFTAQQDHSLGRGIWVRLFGGKLKNRDVIAVDRGEDPITGDKRTEQRKITQITDADGNPCGVLEPGQIGVIYGLGDLPVGYVLGDRAILPRHVEPGSLRAPLITVQAIPKRIEQMEQLRAACSILSDEDPLLHASFIRSLNQLHLQVMGTIQLEILQELLKTRFDLDVTFTEPAIIYKETIAQRATGYVAYLMPKPCWAILRFEIEPAERGSGVEYSSSVPVRTIKPHYQHQVAQAIPVALSQGRLGWEVTDVKITLVDGGDHQFHTHPLDFIVATPMAIQDGLANGGSVLLEPILEARFLLPLDCVGRVMSDVITMRGEVLDNVTVGDRVSLRALIPVRTSMDYSVTLAAATGGRGAMSVRLHGYRDCPLSMGAIAPRRSVDPLDTSRYILAARSALEGGIFDAD